MSVRRHKAMAWRAVVAAHRKAVQTHEAAYDALLNSAEAGLPTLPPALVDALDLPTWTNIMPDDFLDVATVEGVLRSGGGGGAETEISALMASYVEWRAATVAVMATDHRASGDHTLHRLAEARRATFLALLHTCAPDLDALAEKIM